MAFHYSSCKQTKTQYDACITLELIVQVYTGIVTSRSLDLWIWTYMQLEERTLDIH